MVFAPILFRRGGLAALSLRVRSGISRVALSFLLRDRDRKLGPDVTADTASAHS